MKRINNLKLLFCLTAAVCIMQSNSSIAQTPEDEIWPPLESKVPDIKAVDTAMNSLSLYEIKSPWSLVYFYDIACEHCEEASIQLNVLYQNYKEKGVELIALPVSLPLDEWKNIVRKNNYNWKDAFDLGLEGHITFNYQISMLPMIYICDNNKILKARSASVEDIENKLKNYVGE